MNPWDALGRNTDLASADSNIKDISVALYQIFERIGIYGCLICAVIFLAGLALRWGDPRKQSEYKDGVIRKFGVAFAICACSFVLGLILQIAKGSFGY